MMNRFVIFVLAFIGLTSALYAQGEDYKVIIKPEASGESVIELTLDDLDALPKSEFTTKTIWTNGDVTFSGVSLSDLVSEYGADAKNIVATALNDYAIEIPVGDAVSDGPIFATRMNGEVMSRRDKGPFWIVYPYDLKDEYQNETIFARSIWQVKELVFK